MAANAPVLLHKRPSKAQSSAQARQAAATGSAHHLSHNPSNNGIFGSISALMDVSSNAEGASGSRAVQAGHDADMLEEMGHAQELNRQFSPWSMFCLAFTVLGTWSTFSQNLSDGITNGVSSHFNAMQRHLLTPNRRSRRHPLGTGLGHVVQPLCRCVVGRIDERHAHCHGSGLLDLSPLDHSNRAILFLYVCLDQHLRLVDHHCIPGSVHVGIHAGVEGPLRSKLCGGQLWMDQISYLSGRHPILSKYRGMR